MSPVPVITTTDLRKKYKGSGEEALKGIDLSIAKGEFFGLLGPNAAGKSTLISILCGIMEGTSGKVQLFGEPGNPVHTGIKSRIGLVPQDIALYPSLTVMENILFFGRLQNIPGKKLRTKAEECISTFHLEEHQHKLISRCSGGIKRRVNLIAGVLHEPDLILLDEPTLGVDAQLRSVIFDYVVSLNKAGATIIYTTHYMKEAESLCSRVSIIDHGQIITEGEPAALIAKTPGCDDLGQLFLHLTGRDLRD
jgi:ABC-2 type transport system ATP-binding protein